jgi:hypothetical protein
MILPSYYLEAPGCGGAMLASQEHAQASAGTADLCAVALVPVELQRREGKGPDKGRALV